MTLLSAAVLRGADNGHAAGCGFGGGDVCRMGCLCPRSRLQQQPIRGERRKRLGPRSATGDLDIANRRAVTPVDPVLSEAVHIGRTLQGGEYRQDCLIGDCRIIESERPTKKRLPAMPWACAAPELINSRSVASVWHKIRMLRPRGNIVYPLYL
jgi:hypothetical protein